MKRFTCSLLLLLSVSSYAASPVTYSLEYYSGSEFLTVKIQLPEDAAGATETLIIPRSAPGTYAMTDYAEFVEQVTATSWDGAILEGERGDGSYFSFGAGESPIQAFRYRVDISRMESILTEGYASSKLRDNYLGLLGYSVFGFAEGLSDRPVELDITTSPDWPIFSTLAPRTDPPAKQAKFSADSFADLADAQYLLGKDVQIAQVEGAPIPLFLAVYSEAKTNLAEIGRRALLSLNGLAGYFGYVPMPHYTVVLEYLEPPTPAHQYGFWMEHLNSMTGSNDASNAITEFEENPRIGSIVHHMGHSWIPLRSYGEGYRPFEWQVAPLIDTIWLNEGFTWYIANYNVLENKKILEFFRNTTASAPEYIRQSSLKELSRLGSTQYGADFRIGKNLFARGALMAHDLDTEIQEKTKGEKSFRDVMLGLLRWTEKNKRPFRYDEIEPIMSASTGLDLAETWKRWQGIPGLKNHQPDHNIRESADE